MKKTDICFLICLDQWVSKCDPQTSNYQHQPGTLQKCKLLGPTHDTMNQKPWEQSLKLLSFHKLSGTANVQSNLRINCLDSTESTFRGFQTVAGQGPKGKDLHVPDFLKCFKKSIGNMIFYVSLLVFKILEQQLQFQMVIETIKVNKK